MLRKLLELFAVLGDAANDALHAQNCGGDVLAALDLFHRIKAWSQPDALWDVNTVDDLSMVIGG